ncbi:hypothetical protein PRIPAC_74799 [Pristionchus pacificus]|uniref:Piwi domain-containing protein n=1 Tax=Pristionchus pacificus TaxID=54126 RepID=A0A2A6CS84_PRIPA|nr:hypothetical protein PRIPAC_74799 [Pristionchus pacificus]|eukprot:PDM80980.1 hypothetical protein PRIPAC_35983 [Pristionchus pacificus]
MAAPTAEMAKMTLKTAVPAPPQLPKGKKGTAKKVVANSYIVTLKPNVPFYLHDFRVVAVFMRNGEEKLKEVCKQTRDDFTEQERKQAAMLTYLAMKKNGQLKGDFMYDRAALLVSLQEICKGGEHTTVLKKANAPELFALASIKEATEVRVTIKKAADTYQVSTNDLTSRNEATRKALLSVANLATSQTLFEDMKEFVCYGNGNAYLLNPTDHGFPATFDVGCNDKYGGVGLTKGARIVEGPTGPAIAITVDTKKTAFHNDWQFVNEKMTQMGVQNDPVEATALLRGLKAVVFYSGLPQGEQMKRTITIGSVSRQQVRDVTFKDDKGATKRLTDYLRQQYKTTVNGNQFVVLDKYEGNAYSPDCLRIAPNQRVKSENIQPVNIEKLIRESASLPAKRLAETGTLAKCLAAGKANAEQARRGITVETAAPMLVDARQLAPVALGTGNGNVSANGPWRQGKIAQAPHADFKKWTMLHINNGGDPENLGETTARALVTYARNIGYNIQMALNVIHVRTESNQEAQMDQIFAHEKANGSTFIFCIAHARIKNHDLLKAMELKHDVVTQQITSQVAQKVAHQSNTGTNVCLKFIEKLGGQNHYIARTTTDLPAWVTAKATMICGLQMQHPSALSGKEREANTMPSRPVAIGWSVNAVRGASDNGKDKIDQQIEKESTHFSSDWSFAMPKDYKDGEQYRASYKEAVLTMLRTYKEKRGCVPMRIVLFRGGVPEGDYDKIRGEEVPIWQAAFKQLNAAYSPSFIVISVNDAHSDRFYQQNIPGNEKAPKQNLPSGTVIDSGVTNPNLPMAYVQSHVPLQGTAKVPSIVVQHCHLEPSHKLVVTMDDVIRMTYALAFSHGVCNTPTAVPTPLYIARESMKRANELFNFWNKRSGGNWTIDDIKQKFTMNPTVHVNCHGLRINA